MSCVVLLFIDILSISTVTDKALLFIQKYILRLINFETQNYTMAEKQILDWSILRSLSVFLQISWAIKHDKR